MKSEMSLFNRGIFYNSLKSHGWLGVVHLLALLFSVPLQILMYYSRSEFIVDELIRKILIHSEIFRVIILILPVMLGILLFRYIQVKESAVMIHSLPVTRRDLFRTKVITGIGLLIIPVAITALVTATIRTGFGMENYFTLQDVFYWFFYTFIFELIMFLATVLVGMVTGMSTAQGVLTYIMLFLPVGLSMLVLVNLEFLIYGFTNNFAIEQIINKFSPLITIMNLRFEKIKDWTEVISYLLISGLFYMLAVYLYKRRQVEAATQTIAFRGLKQIFKYGVTFCCMLLGGIYFKETGAAPYWVYIGYFFGSFFGYLAAEMILSKSIKVFDKLKGYGIYSAIMVILFIGISLDVIGYQGKVPELGNVQSIYFGSNYYGMPNEQIKIDTYSNESSLKEIRELHKLLIADKNLSENRIDYRFGYQEVQQFVFVYNLKNGNKVIRGYYVPLKKYSSQIKAIYKGLEYKQKHYPELAINSERINQIIIGPTEIPTMKKAVILNPVHIKEALAILKQEIMNTEIEIIGNRPPRAGIMLYLDNGEDIPSTWNRSFKALEKWMKEKGYWVSSVIQPEDISYIRVEKVEYDKDTVSVSEKAPLEGKFKGKEFTNKQQIAECLEKVNLSNSAYDKVFYMVTFFSKDKRENFGGQLFENNVPSFISDSFNK